MGAWELFFASMALTAGTAMGIFIAFVLVMLGILVSRLIDEKIDEIDLRGVKKGKVN